MARMPAASLAVPWSADCPLKNELRTADQAQGAGQTATGLWMTNARYCLMMNLAVFGFLGEPVC